MTKKIVFGAALVLVVAGLAAPSASALCNPPKFASTYNSATQAASYWHTSLPAGSTLVGKLWSSTGDHTGTCNTTAQIPMLYFGATPGDVGFTLAMGDPCVVGCPSGSLSIQATAINGAGSEIYATKAVEAFVGGLNFDFSNTAHAMGAYPRPRVTGSSRAGNNVNLNLAIDAIAPFLGDAAADITGFNILSASGATDPGRLASAYTLRSTVAAPGGGGGTGTASVDCSAIANDQWVVAQLVSATGGPSNTVGAATRVKCNPALANPKFNVVPKKTMGTGTSH